MNKSANIILIYIIQAIIFYNLNVVQSIITSELKWNGFGSESILWAIDYSGKFEYTKLIGIGNKVGGYGMIQPKARQKIFFIIQPLHEFIVR